MLQKKDNCPEGNVYNMGHVQSMVCKPQILGWEAKKALVIS